MFYKINRFQLLVFAELNIVEKCADTKVEFDILLNTFLSILSAYSNILPKDKTYTFQLKKNLSVTKEHV